MSLEYKFPPMVESTEENGLKLIILPDDAQPVITTSIRIYAGEFNVEGGFPGAAEMLSALIQKGCGGESAEDFAHLIESKGADISVTVKERFVTIRLEVMKKYFEDIISYLYKMVSSPNFEKREFDIVKKEIITGFTAELSNPAYLSSAHFNAELFGNENPAGRGRNKKILKSITLEDLKKYFNTYYLPNNSTIIVAGDIKIDETHKIISELFGKWQKCPLPNLKSERYTIKHIDNNIIRLINKPELTQTTLNIGFESLGELHEDKLALSIANYILGGGDFTSRLMKKIRSELGSTYGIASRIWLDIDQGAFRITTSTQNDKLKKVISSILKTLKVFTVNGVSEEELQTAKSFLAGSMAFQFEGINSLVSRLQWLRFYNRENSYLETFQQRLSEIDLNTLNRVIKSNFRSENLIITAVGKTKVIESILSEFGEVKKYNFRKLIVG